MTKAIVSLEIEYNKRSCFYKGIMHCPYLRSRDKHSIYFCSLFSENSVIDILEPDGTEVLRHINCFNTAKPIEETKIIYRRSKKSKNILKNAALTKGN